MHEMTITKALYDLALSEAQAHDAEQVTGLRVQVGALTGIDPSAVVFYLETISKGSPLEGAHVAFEKSMPAAKCRACEHQMTIPVEDNTDQLTFSHMWLRDYADMVCEQCGQPDFELVGGNEFALISMDVA